MSENKRIRVALVENDDVYRESLAALIRGEPDYTCVGAFASAEGALRSLLAAQPQVILLDLRLPRMSGQEVIPHIRRLLPGAHIIVVTVEDSPATLYRALESGASGYLVKPVTSTRILRAIDEAYEGGAPMTSQIARLVLETFRRRGEARKELDVLSSREYEVLARIAEGLRNAEIARVLGISPRTVAAHVRGIYEKLHVHNRSAAASRFLSPQVGK